MSKRSDLKLKQQAITEWWAFRQARQLPMDNSEAKLLSICAAVAFVLLIAGIQFWAILYRLLVEMVSVFQLAP
ncbi:MAG: hypothetical protein AAF078_06715 [Planctomycetota bacterium]